MMAQKQAGANNPRINVWMLQEGFKHTDLHELLPITVTWDWI